MPSSDSLPSTERLALGGVLGGALGFVGGGLLGGGLATLTGAVHPYAGAVAGAVVGEVVGIPVGVHTADGGRGSFWSDLGISALVGSITVGTANLVRKELELDHGTEAAAWTVVAVGVPLQIGLTVHTERSTR